ncbi:HD domain-containing protein [Cupriavidus basilensis]|uniref:HD domain-containing protein n=1 Tax=Cupriavidus basilensis TaxID=68895 RepID=UPI0039F64FAD
MSILTDKAAAFAHAAHAAAGHKRKYTGEDYIVHPYNVSSRVASVTNDENMIAAAWLHDVVEDTRIDLGMIAYFFGDPVAALVHECSHIDHANDPRKLSRFERMAIELARAADISPQAKTIKLADLLDNTASIAEHDPKFAKVYMAEKRRLISVLIGGDERLWREAASQVEAYYQKTTDATAWPTMPGLPAPMGCASRPCAV